MPVINYGSFAVISMLQFKMKAMKKILSIIFLLISYNVIAQLPSSTFKSRIFTGNTEASWILLDSPVVNPILDTFYARYPGTQIVRIQGGDTSFWFYGGNRRWFRSLQAPDTISLSNRINLKLNISDTTNQWWGIGKRWVDTMYRVNDSTIGYTINNGTQRTFQILGRSSGGGGGGSGTVTSVGLSMPSAFTVGGTNPVTSSGTIAVSGAGTTAQYIRGNGTLATTDTSMIPNYYLKVRGLLSGTSPITFNQTTGIIGVLRANNTGQLGVATFNNTDFTDNGVGLISLRNPSGNPGVDTIYRTEGVDSIYFTINGVTYAIKDSTGEIITASNGLTKVGNDIRLGDATGPGAPLINNTYIDAGSAFGLNLTGSLTLGSSTGVMSVSNTGTGNSIYASATTGSGVKGAATSGNAVFGIATTGVGGQFNTTSGVAAIQGYNSGGWAANLTSEPSTTNTNQAILTINRGTTGTAANDIAGSLDFRVTTTTTPYQLSNQIISKLTNATNASYASQLEFWGANSATVTRKAALASTGQWTWDGYPSLTKQTDSSIYKPIAYDASGNIVPMIGWPSGGGASTPNLQSVLTAGSTLTQSNTINYAGYRQSFKSGLTIVDSLSIIPAAYKADSIVFAGTSITLGIGTTFTVNYTTLTSQQLNSVQSNHGISGAQLCVAGIADTVNLPNYDANKYWWFISEWGVNDMHIGTYDSTTFSNTYKLYIDALVRKGWPLSKIRLLQNGVVCPCIDAPATLARQQQFRDAISAVGVAKGVSVVDIYSLELQRGGYTELTADGIHPNQYATPLYAALIAQSVGDSVRNQNQSIASNSLNEFQNIKIRTTKTGDYRTSILGTDTAGNLVRVLSNTYIFNTLEPNILLPQPGGIYMTGQGRFSNIYTKGSGSSASDSLNALYVQGVTTLAGQLTAFVDADINGLTIGRGGGNSATNTALGAFALNSNTSGSHSVAVGNLALRTQTTTFGNVAVGESALESVQTNCCNVAIGFQAGISSLGPGNVFIGSQAGSAGSYSNKFFLSNAGATNLLYGDFSNGHLVINPGGTPADDGVGTAQIHGKITVYTHALGSNSDSAVIWDRSTNEYKIAAINGSGGTTLYTGDDTLSGNRTVTGSSNSLTFSGVNLFRVYSNYLYQAKSDGTRAYASAIDPSSTGRQSWQFGYSPFTRGVGLYVDTLNNVGLGDNTITTMPLYTTGNSAYVRNGFQSQQGNFYGITNVSSTSTLGLTDNFCVIDATSGNITITLPATSAAFAGGMGLDLVFKRIDNSGNTVTIQRSGSDQIDGTNSFTLPAQYDSKKIRAISTTAWAIYQ